MLEEVWEKGQITSEAAGGGYGNKELLLIQPDPIYGSALKSHVTVFPLVKCSLECGGVDSWCLCPLAQPLLLLVVGLCPSGWR